MLRITKTLIVAALAYAAALVPAFAEKRVALVIGNSAYKHAASLKNPKNDATGMAAALRRLGFRVFEGTDLDRRGLETRIRDFANDIADADVALFYYAGHGLQVNGTNYLAPVDATLKAEADLDFEAVPLKLVLRQMQRSARINLVFLDACRDNPLAKKLGKASRSLAVGQGLAAVEKAAGMLIAFAT
ncbi:MAG: caspase family protein, partial [Methyloligellaceae bacterium]